MILSVANEIVDFAEEQGLREDHITPCMMDSALYPIVAASAREPLAILVFNGFYSSLSMLGQMYAVQFLLFVLQNPPLLCLRICLSLVKVSVTRLV